MAFYLLSLSFHSHVNLPLSAIFSPSSLNKFQETDHFQITRREKKEREKETF